MYDDRRSIFVLFERVGIFQKLIGQPASSIHLLKLSLKLFLPERQVLRFFIHDLIVLVHNTPKGQIPLKDN